MDYQNSEDTSQTTKNVSFIPSLHHLTCCHIVSTIFNHLEAHKNFRLTNPVVFKNKVKVSIARLTPNARLRAKLEKHIDPLFREILEWLKVFERSWYGYDSVLCAILESLPGCWISDGTIDREKSAKLLVKNTELRPINRFVIACTFCLFDKVLELWDILYRIEKAYLKHKSTPAVKHWVEWMESNPNKDWELFAASTLGTPLLSSNVYLLKRVLRTLCPAEKNRYLLPSLVGQEINSDVMRFGMSILTREDQEQIFKDSPVEVFRCISSWPLRSIFYDVVDYLWPYITSSHFCGIINLVLKQIQNRNSDYAELLIILKTFWNQSPRNFQDVVKDDPVLSKPLQFILDCDASQVFQKQKYLDTFMDEFPQVLPRPQPQARRRRRRRAVRRRYRNVQ